MVKPVTHAKHPPELPDPLEQEPPNDKWCDIVMKGGVASGVVYPWAILEIARHYRLRNIGGTSVGAMAAAIAAGCEYGRRVGRRRSFEVLRQLPSELGDSIDGVNGQTHRTRMLSLFQPIKSGRRLFNVFVEILDSHYENHHYDEDKIREQQQPSNASPRSRSLVLTLFSMFSTLFKHYCLTWPALLVTLGLGIALFSFFFPSATSTLYESIFAVPPPAFSVGRLGMLFISILTVLATILTGIIYDIKKGIVDNNLGLCHGGTIETDGNTPALIEWLHESIQRAAGLRLDAKPLNFEDLWNAPLWPGGVRPKLDRHGTPIERSINLEMVTTNVTHGRPYHLPLTNKQARLFFDPDMWDEFFPDAIMCELRQSSSPYLPLSSNDPSAPDGAARLLELPGAKLPIVVAARLSLSYPILFSTIPLYALDYEESDPEKRQFRLCRFSDGGLCSNFPVHFFDSALPRWPTFGLSLEDRKPPHIDSDAVAVYLPEKQDDAWHDGWYRFEPNSNEPEQMSSHRDTNECKRPAAQFKTLQGFLWHTFLTSKDWRDRTAVRMPHVRRRVARLRLISSQGEGQLNIAMPQNQILEMASIYGTNAGKQLSKQYSPIHSHSAPTKAWREHLWVRLQILLQGLNDLLANLDAASTSQGHTLKTRQLLDRATQQSPIDQSTDQSKLTCVQRDELNDLIAQIVELENALSDRSDMPHMPEPLPELGLRPPL